MKEPKAQRELVSRRALLCTGSLACLVPLLPAIGFADEPAAAQPASASETPRVTSQLPLKTTGLEHLGTIVPDVVAAGKFYGRLFNPELYKEKDPPLRYYVTLGVGYLALGSRPNQTRAFFDHFCALVTDYDAPAMAQQLKTEGLPAGRYGIIPDPDGIGLQLLGVPGGLAKTTEPAGRIVDGEPLVRPERLTHVVLHVSDLEKSMQFYRRFLGPETRGKRRSGEVSFQVAETRLILEMAAAGEPPRVDRVGIRVQPFDHRSVSRELARLGAQVTSHSKRDLRFTDPFGLGMELESI
jgi:catechol 2,3-dioxygenase-like lactoylglutathione lyase family enzyme